MKPSEQDLRELNRQEQRLRVYKERMWIDRGHWNPKNEFILASIAALIIALISLFLSIIIITQ